MHFWTDWQHSASLLNACIAPHQLHSYCHDTPFQTGKQVFHSSPTHHGLPPIDANGCVQLRLLVQQVSPQDEGLCVEVDVILAVRCLQEGQKLV